MEQIIWKNRYIQLPDGLKKKKTKAIFWPKLYEAGIGLLKVKDIFNPEGAPINLATFCQEKNIAYNFLHVYRVTKKLFYQTGLPWLHLTSCICYMLKALVRMLVLDIMMPY